MPRGGKTGSDRTQVDAALAGCYEAVLSPDAWPTALDALARSFNAAGAGFYGCLASEPSVLTPVSASLGEALEQFVKERWWERDHRAKRSVPLMLLGRNVVVEHEVVTEEERRELPVYRKLYLRHGLPWWAAVAGRPDRDSLWALNFFRSDRQGPFLPKDAVDLGRLEPHLGRMIDLAHRFAGASIRTAMARLEYSGLPAALIDRQGRLLELNPGAEAVFGPEFAIVDGRMTTRRRDENAALQRLLDHAAAGKAAPRAVVSLGASGRLLIDTVPTSGFLGDAFGRAAAILLMRTGAAARRPVDQVLTRVFGLTPVETQLAMMLGEGRTVMDAAEQLRTTPKRAQERLRAIVHKTGARSAEELAGRLEAFARRRPRGVDRITGE